jgi:hypothetical protein
MTTLERQEQVDAYREHPTRAAAAMVPHIEASRRYRYIYIAAALRHAIGEGAFANGLLGELDGRQVRMFYTRYGRSQAHHYKAYAKFESDWSPVRSADLHRIVNVTLNK